MTSSAHPILAAAPRLDGPLPDPAAGVFSTTLVAAGRGDGQGATVACLGLAFKADIDDLRESPALLITETLAAELPGTRVLAVEPHVGALPPALAAL